MSSTHASAYKTVTGGGLKLKVALKRKKKKKKSKKSKKPKTDLSEIARERLTRFEEEEKRKLEEDEAESLEIALALKAREDEDKDENAPDDSTRDTRTATQKAFDKRYQARINNVQTKKMKLYVNQSHRARVEEFNMYLANLSEHHDVPKVGNAGLG